MTNVNDILVETANTADNPKVTRIKVWAGFLEGGRIVFPLGCANTIRVQVFIGGHQIAPIEPATYFSGDGRVVPWKSYVPLFAGENEIKIIAWNAGANYDHRITTELDIAKEEYVVLGAILKQLAESIDIFSEKVRTYF